MTQDLLKIEVENCFATRFVLPGWWVKAYEVAATGSITSSVVAQIMDAGIAPALNQIELNGLADLVTTIQRQILFDKEQGPRCVTIDPQKHVKHASSSSPSRMNSFERTLFGISGLRILAKRDLKNQFRTVRLVAEEFWDSSEDQTYRLKLALTESAPELFLGYTNNYLEIERLIESRVEVLPLQHASPPLSLWRSAWLDLQGVDQLVLLRLEQAMQWDFCWLQLDGVFGKALDELFTSVPNQQESLSGAEIFKIVDRVGKRLYDHGLLTFDVADQYLAFSHEASLMLAWQASKDRLHEHEANAYAKKVRQFFVHQIAQSRHEGLMAAIGGHTSYGSMVSSIVNQWQSLVSELSEDENIPVGFASTSHPILAPLLFLEWNLRSLPGHVLPMPDSLSSSEPIRCCDPFSSKGMQERYREFYYLMHDQADYQAMVENVSGASFAAPKMLQDQDFRTYLKKFARSKREVYTGPTSEAGSKISEPVVHPQASSQEVRKDGFGVSPQSSRPSFNLKKLVIEELDAMRLANDQRYEDLKQAYVNSLDSQKKTSLMDVEKRMQKNQFEALLKNHLLKFMIENPACWKSAKPMRTTITPKSGL